MIICPECGEENPQGSKFCRKCGITLIHEEPKTEPKKDYTTAKKVTVETNERPIRTSTVNTHSSTSNNNKNNDTWCWGCCICMFFLFIIFAIFGH